MPSVRLGARKLIHELLEAEVTELLGRGRYARREPGQEGARSGYKPRALRCAEGRLEMVADGRAGAPGGGDVRPGPLYPGHRGRTGGLERAAARPF